MKDHLKPLEHINRVEANPYLLTRIRQRLKDVPTEAVPTYWLRVATLTFLLIVLSDWLAIQNAQPSANPDAQLYLSLMPNNDIYHE